VHSITTTHLSGVYCCLLLGGEEEEEEEEDSRFPLSSSLPRAAFKSLFTVAKSMGCFTIKG
jgi:hypothetical protein